MIKKICNKKKNIINSIQLMIMTIIMMVHSFSYFYNTLYNNFLLNKQVFNFYQHSALHIYYKPYVPFKCSLTSQYILCLN